MTAKATPTNAPPCILNFRSPLLLFRRTATHAIPDQPILNRLKSLELQDHIFLYQYLLLFLNTASHVLDRAGPLCERWIKNSGNDLWVAIIAPPPWEHRSTGPCVSPHLATADSSPVMMGSVPAGGRWELCREAPNYTSLQGEPGGNRSQ